MKNKLKINCFIHNSLDRYQYHISIYDLQDNLIFDKLIKQDNFVYFIPPYHGVYKIKIIVLEKIPIAIYHTTFLYKPGYDHISFYFYRYNHSPIVIQLTDQYYTGLKIQEGEMRLWQNRM